MEQSDIVPVLKEFDFTHDPQDASHSTLIVTNPPVINFEGFETNDAVNDLDDN